MVVYIKQTIIMGACYVKMPLPYGVELVLSNAPNQDKSKMLLALNLEYDNFNSDAKKKIDELTKAHIAI